MRVVVDTNNIVSAFLWGRRTTPVAGRGRSSLQRASQVACPSDGSGTRSEASLITTKAAQIHLCLTPPRQSGSDTPVFPVDVAVVPGGSAPIMIETHWRRALSARPTRSLASSRSIPVLSGVPGRSESWANHLYYASAPEILACLGVQP